MFISSCSQEDSNPMFETNSETHINNLESKALPSVLVTIWIRKQVSFGQYVAITGDGAELGNWTPANSMIVFQKVWKFQFIYFCNRTVKNNLLWNLHLSK